MKYVFILLFCVNCFCAGLIKDMNLKGIGNTNNTYSRVVSINISENSAECIIAVYYSKTKYQADKTDWLYIKNYSFILNPNENKQIKKICADYIKDNIAEYSGATNDNDD